MRTIIQKPLLALLALWFVVSGCDAVHPPEATDTTTETLTSVQVAQMAVQVSSELQLSGTTARNVSSSFNKHADKQPGFLWGVAKDLQATLTAEEKEKLLNPDLDAAGNREGGLRPFFSPHGMKGDGIKGTGRPGFIPFDLLTEDQKAQVKTVMEKYGTEIKALMDKKSTLTTEEFKSQMEALHTARQAELTTLLTEEQKATIATRLEEAKARLEAARAAEKESRNTVLAIDAATSDKLDAAYAAQLTALEALATKVKNKEIAIEDVPAQLQAIREAFKTTISGFLSATQVEIVLIHDALTHRKPKGHGGKGKGGPNAG
ncbi:MAG: hypothetical protein JNN12_12660 [Bacteroidetes Order II. Incertae sedis bacterium]|nr:hypothetical protein [Bacteroidetes Order II. bacterium]